ncbi:ArgS-related anticodon-binding protein NrtL [Streptomyces aureus]|uniref:ArgS-related anticodon-binding protein NrtL n=1 Tax=Streptomyces aureus TaxID=193461 RepID=UPI0033E3D1D4
MTPVELSRTVLRAVRRAVDDGELDGVSVPEGVVVAPPGAGGCGDYATNVALRLAGQAKLPAAGVAEVLRRYLADEPGVAGVTVTGPGFLNITLAGGATAGLVEEVLERGARYGHGDTLAGQVVELRVPYDTRAEIVADTLVRIVATQGGRAEVRHSEPVNLRPVPASEDPAPLGHDAARWALLHPAPHDRPRISADHLLQRESNPLFRVRYAHARTRALRRNAATLGFSSDADGVGVTAAVGVGVTASVSTAATPGPSAVRPAGASAPKHSGVLVGLGTGTGVGTGTGYMGAPLPAPGADPAGANAPLPASGADPAGANAPLPASGADPAGSRPSQLTPTPTPTPTPAEADLLAALAGYPHALRLAARDRAPDRLARHLVVTADALLGFQHVVLPLGDEKPSAAHRARLALAEAAGAVLAGGLSLLGISAPEHL